MKCPNCINQMHLDGVIRKRKGIQIGGETCLECGYTYITKEHFLTLEELNEERKQFNIEMELPESKYLHNLKALPEQYIQGLTGETKMSLSKEDIQKSCNENDWDATDKHLKYLIEVYGEVGSAASFVMPRLLEMRTRFNKEERTDALKKDIWGVAL